MSEALPASGATRAAAGSGPSAPPWARLLSAFIVLVFTGVALYEVPHLRRVLRETGNVLKEELAVGPEPGAPGALVVPFGLAVADGRVYVTDVEERSLRIYSAEDGRLLRTVTKGGDGTSDLLSPAGVAVAPDGGVQLIDSGTGRVETYAADGTPAGFASGEALGLYGPRGLAVAANGDRVIADSGTGRVLRVSTAGELLWAYRGSPGPGGALVEPWAVAIDARGHVVVADSGTAHVQELDAGGALLRSVRVSGRLTGIAVTGQRILVAAADPETIWLIEPDGRTFHLTGGSGEAILSSPQGVAGDARGRVWIVTGGQVKRYALAKRR